MGYTSDQIEAIKKRENLDEVFLITVGYDDEKEEQEGEVAQAVLRKPSRAIVGRFLSIIDNDIPTACELLLESCWIEGDERIKTDDEYFFGATTQLSDIVSYKAASLKKF